MTLERYSRYPEAGRITEDMDEEEVCSEKETHWWESPWFKPCKLGGPDVEQWNEKEIEWLKSFLRVVEWMERQGLHTNKDEKTD